MKRITPIVLLTISLTAFSAGQSVGYAQSMEAVPESAESKSPSTKKTILLNIAKAIVDVLCVETGNCAPAGDRSSERDAPRTREDRGFVRTPGFAGGAASPGRSSARTVVEPKNFSFSTPVGWQRYADKSSVTVALPSEYINGNLTNGVILGLFEMKNANFEQGTETFVRQLVANNNYFNRFGYAESSVVNGIKCLTNRMQGQSPKTGYLEHAVVYTCQRNTAQLFYVVTVNSGPNANRYEEDNNRITQSISLQ